MTAERGLFVRQTGTAPTAVGTTPTQARLALAGLVYENAPGVPRSGLMGQSNFNVVTGTASTAPMSYDVGALVAVVNRATNEGVYMFAFTGTTNVTTTAAPGSGSRYDLIYVKQNDPDKGDADNNTIVGVVQGTASAGTPTKPYSDPAVVAGSGALVLAEAQVFSGATATNGASVVITQVFPYTAARRGNCPIRDATDLATLTSPALGASIVRRDRTGELAVWDGTAWRSLVRLESVYAPLGISNGAFGTSGDVIVEQVGTRKLVTVNVRVNRVDSSALAVGTTFLDLGAALPVEARGGNVGNELYFPVSIVGGVGPVNVVAQAAVHPVTGKFWIQGTAAFNWTNGALTTFNCQYMI